MSNNQWTPWPQTQPQQPWQPGIQQASALHQQLHQHQQYNHQQTQQGGVHIQTQLAQAREEQRAREVELQRRRMETMNVAQAKPLTSLDSLIGLEGMSPASRKKQTRPEQQTPAQQPQPHSKPRAWTANPTDLQGVFSQHTVLEDNFGEFHGPPPPVVITSSYTRPISSVRGSPVIGGRARTTSSPHTTSSQLNTSAFPPLFSEVYSRCVKDGVLSTELLFPVLMSSSLPKQQLGQLWQLANRETPGRLTKTELFVLLGLIGLAQNGHPNPTFADLKKAKSPPVPVLEAMKPQVVDQPAALNSDFGSFQQGPTVSNSPVLSNPRSLQPSTQFSAPLPSLPLAASTVPLSMPVVPTQPLSTPSSISSSQTTQTFGDKYSAFGDLQSVQPSLPSDVLSPSVAPQTSASDDKYSAFSELQSIQPPIPSDILSSTVAPQTSASDDKYSAFGGLYALQPPVASGTFFSELSSSTAPSIFNSTSTQPGANLTSSSNSFSVSKAEDKPGDDFGSFVSVAPSLDPPAEVHGSSDGWADFSKPMEPLASKPPFPLPSTSNAPSSSATLAGLESIVMTELTAATANPPSNGAKKADDKQIKPLTGLDILDREMDARLLSKESTEAEVANINKPLVPESLDDFGEFESFGGSQVNSVPSQETLPERSSVDKVALATTCLQKCAEVLESCVAVFKSVEEGNLLSEIAESEEGRNKLTGIVEVYRVAKRMYCALKQKKSDSSLAELRDQIKDYWTTLQSLLPNNVMSELYAQSQPTQSSPTLSSDPLSDTISTCSLCQAGKSITIAAEDSLDGQKEDYPVSLYFHNGQCCHALCANFWLNVVQEQLPIVN